MSAFLALIWSSHQPESRQEARRLIDEAGLRPSRAFRSEEAGLYVADLSALPAGRRLLSLGDNGAVFGKLFARSSTLSPAACLSELSPAATAAIRASGGQSLLTGYWGSYVAFVKHRAGLTVIADPASSIPCFYTRRGPVMCVFSHLERCPAAFRRGLTINRAFVSQLLAYDKIQNGATGLNEVRELQSGFCLAVSEGGSEEALAWDPRELGRRPDTRPAAEAADELRQTIRLVVQSHGMSAPKLAVNVSGGLDSAIVAAMLSEPANRFDIQAIHFVLQGGDPSETAYARALAGFLRLDLSEIRVDPAQPLPAPDQYPPTVRPYREFLGQALLASMAAEEGRATFTGQGGDHLFLETRSPLMFADHVRRCGLGRDTLGELMNAARLSEQSVWRVARDTWPALLLGEENRRNVHAGMADRQTRINRRAHAGLDPADLLPVWARRPEGTPPEKFRQVAGLVHMVQIRNALAPEGVAPLTHPLISQPLIELCLKIPADVLCAGGVPRGLARLAVTGLIPDMVRLRRSKGDASRFFIEQLGANQALLSEALRGGELVADGYADPADIEACLAPENYRTQTFGRMILVYYVIECWLRRWKTELGALQAPR
jgi:asparagine synthase (glutamine-hydrolysing)